MSAEALSDVWEVLTTGRTAWRTFFRSNTSRSFSDESEMKTNEKESSFLFVIPGTAGPRPLENCPSEKDRL